MSVDYYKVLMVDPRASFEVIRASYRALAKEHSDNDARLRQLNEAKEILLDNDKRLSYDASLRPKGKVIGPYRLLEKIAEGGFGTTYKAEHTTLKTLVCIKHALNISPLDEALLLDEARAIWDLRHFAIPAIRDILRMPDGSLSLVMSYVPGKTLGEVIEKNPKGMDPEHVAWITQRVLNVLKYLHMHGVIHGDVKPQNILVQNESHTIVLVDYGLSLVRPRTGNDTKGYTMYFAAPEQVDGKTLLPESDLYGLGMTMCALLGGNVKTFEVPLHLNKCPELVKLMKRLIRRDPLQRPRVWKEEDLCETIRKVRMSDFGREESGMKPLEI